jgi:hypothetical protein
VALALYIAVSFGTEVRTTIDDLIGGFTGGAAIGTLVAYRRIQRGVLAGRFQIVTRWSMVGALAALVLTAHRVI